MISALPQERVARMKVPINEFALAALVVAVLMQVVTNLDLRWLRW